MRKRPVDVHPAESRRRRLTFGRVRMGCFLAVGVAFALSARAAEVSDAQALYNAGEYAECAEMAAQAIEDGAYAEEWRLLKIRADLAVGKYGEAKTTLEKTLEVGRFQTSLQLLWLGRDVWRHAGESAKAVLAMEDMVALIDKQSWRYRNIPDTVLIGRIFLEAGADAKLVLTDVFREVQKQAPRDPEAFIAAGDLALAKHDYALAAGEYEKALKLDEEDPRIYYGLAQAYDPSDSEKTTQALQKALELNPRFVPALLMLVDGHVDAERYDEANEVLAKIFKVNPLEPLAWAYRAVLAHLNNDREAERTSREKALSTWKENPEVDYLIGKKLSQKYRFEEGAQSQRKALAFAPKYLPAKVQLCNDLLRLGEELEGWKLADEVFSRDNYNVVAHNLTTLRNKLSNFRTLEKDNFRVRMDAHEADVYGERALDLLSRAKRHLCPKYGVELSFPVYVEIYPQQQDFAIRTFGLPGGEGFLGVCFGKVITMNSPASRGANPVSWESVLWHEFCHVVTLTKTRNRMPRWLSEGISVYEERDHSSGWGQSMDPAFRKMILDGELTPVSGLSGAFLHAPSSQHLNFAYFESSLVVEYIVDNYGIEALNAILDDLGKGLLINDAISRHADPIELLDDDFEEFAIARAKALAPEADLDTELPKLTSLDEIREFLQEHPNHFEALKGVAAMQIRAKRWDAAKITLERMIDIYPGYNEADGAYPMLAAVYRELGETTREREVLEDLASLNAEAFEVYLRLMELAANQKDWTAVIRNADRALAVNPLLPAPHRYLAEAAEHTGDDSTAIAALETLITMQPFDPANVHYRAAALLEKNGRVPEARNHVLRALEDAPRFRDAHKLLLRIHARNTPPENEPLVAPRPGGKESS